MDVVQRHLFPFFLFYELFRNLDGKEVSIAFIFSFQVYFQMEANHIIVSARTF